MLPGEESYINVDGTVFPCMAIDVGNVKNKTKRHSIFKRIYEI